MKTPWSIVDINKGQFKFRPIDILDADNQLLFRISDGDRGKAIADKIVKCVNLVHEAAK